MNQLMKKMFSQRRSEQSSAAEEVAGNEDLLNEILLRVPVKHLIRIQLVSKQWLSLISDPRFARNHTRRRNPNSFVPSGLFFYNSPARSLVIESVSLLDHNSPNQPYRVRLRARVPSLSFLDPVAEGVRIRILQSCKGLLLCCFTFKSSDYVVRHCCVCNPTTKKYTILPQPDVSLTHEPLVDFNLAFDPSESPHYRVVCIKAVNGACAIDIYSSEKGSWRSSVCDFPVQMFSRFDGRVYSNGSIHWICPPNSTYFSIHFDINSEQLKTIEKSQFWSKYFEGRAIGYFGECRGHLHLITFRSNINSAEQFEVLAMDRDTFGWSVRYQVDINRIISAFPQIVQKTCLRGFLQTDYAFSILCVVEGEEKEDSALVLAIPGKVISYNFKHMTSRVLCELPSKVVNTSHFNCITASQYIEALSSV